MIELYKLGMWYYLESKEDKNSGLYEKSIIQKELKNVIDCNHDILVILNGKVYGEDKKNLKIMWDEFKYHIFIMTDSVALENESLQIINNCDFVLHQAPGYKFKEINARQYYSFVPELFYKYCPLDDLDKKDSDLVFFGGNDSGRVDKFKDYNFFNSKFLSLNRTKLSMQNEVEVDGRINYLDYLNELRHYQYSLVICREKYRECSWLTARFFESLAVGVLPIVDVDFDKKDNLGCLFRFDKFGFRKVSNEKELIKYVKFLNDNPNVRNKLLSKMKESTENRLKGFTNIMNYCIMNLT